MSNPQQLKYKSVTTKKLTYKTCCEERLKKLKASCGADRRKKYKQIDMKILCFVILTILSVACQQSRTPVLIETENLESPVITSDISNQRVTAFVEDAQGHIWVGTSRGLNKSNVYEFHQYFCIDDSVSLPDNQIQTLFRDSKDRLWIGTTNGACQYTSKDNFHHISINDKSQNAIQFLENKEGKIFLNMDVHLCVYNVETDEFDSVIPDFDPERSFNLRCYMDNENNLWAVNLYGLRCYNSTTLELKDSISAKNYINYAYMHNKQELWLASDNNLSLFDTRTKKYIELPDVLRNSSLLANSKIDYIHPYENNSLLINTSNGMFLYNYIIQTLVHQNENGFPFELPHFKISQMFTDSQKNLWIGSIDQGFTVRYNYKTRFNTNNYLRTFIKNKSIVALAADKENNLWIATLSDGLFMYNIDSKKVNRIELHKILPQIKKESINLGHIFVDKDNTLWLTIHPNLIAKCRYKNGNLQCEDYYQIPVPMCINQDKDGTIWVGNYSENIYALRPNEKEFTPIELYPKGFNFTSCLLPLSTGEILISSFAKPLQLIHPGSRVIRELEIQEEDLQKVIRRSVFIPTSLYEDSRGNIWIGTVGNGLLHYNSSTHSLQTMLGISCSDICSIEEDAQGNIWISTQYGLSKYDSTIEKFTNYYAADGIGGNQFYDRSSCRLSDGNLIFGGTHGLTYFNPIDITFKRNIPLLFEDLKIHNKLIRPDESLCINKHLSYRPNINLKHNQNSFSISFAALDYSENERVHYHYKMEGYDKYWIDAHNNREAYYANLPAGRYDFKVKITNNDQSIIEAENSIKVIVEPAPWLTWWAWSSYLLIAAIIIGFFVRFWLRIKQEKEITRRAELEKEQEQRVNKMNMSFFANVSHEFRTPLTMISGPVTQLCESPEIEGENKQLLYIVQRSVGRMLRLVNQLMDFNKLENDTLKLQVRRTDIITQLQRFVDIFRINANEKGIVLKSYGLEDTFLMWLDVDKLDKIIGNLLFNALKFSSNGGKIELYFDVITREEALKILPKAEKAIDTQYVKISVEDGGSGIPEDQLEKIFERYYQLNNQEKGKYNWGTGIGLYYARSLANLHHGYLIAGNRSEGVGAVFTLLLPVSDLSYNQEEYALLEEEQSKVFPLQTTDQFQLKVQEDIRQNKQTLLVVDDDSEVVHYLKVLLSQFYKVVCRFDADSAFKAMSEEAPDLVLSDVVMPGRSGYDLCREIKEDLQLCHIPVILVTAKVTVENQVEGLNTGADAYVTKPFEPNYLLALIKSQLKNREKVRNLLSESTQMDKIEENVLAPQDNSFMTELYHLMENELSNPELDVAGMTELLKISRTKFYYKVKGLTGKNPSVFFRTYKLNRAAELIREGKYNISEIADVTGFSTLSHFSTSFKKQFGVSPSEYLKS